MLEHSTVIYTRNFDCETPLYDEIMSNLEYIHLLTGSYACELDDGNLSSVKHALMKLKDAFGAKTNFTLEFYLQQIANATTMTAVKAIVAPFWTYPEIEMINLLQLLTALNRLIKTFDENKKDIFLLKSKGKAVHVYTRTVKLETEFDSESLADELSASSEKDLSVELKLAEERFSQENRNIDVLETSYLLEDVIDDIDELDTTKVAIGKFSTPTNPMTPDNPWILPTKSKPPPTISVAKKDLESSNPYGVLEYDDEDDNLVNDPIILENDSTFMQQSLDSAVWIARRMSRRKG